MVFLALRGVAVVRVTGQAAGDVMSYGICLVVIKRAGALFPCGRGGFETASVTLIRAWPRDAQERSTYKYVEDAYPLTYRVSIRGC